MIIIYEIHCTWGMMVPTGSTASLLDDIEDLLDQSKEGRHPLPEVDCVLAHDLEVDLDGPVSIDPASNEIEADVHRTGVEGGSQPSRVMVPPEYFCVEPEPVGLGNLEMGLSGHNNVEMSAYHVVRSEPLGHGWEEQTPELASRELLKAEAEETSSTSTDLSATRTEKQAFSWTEFVRSTLGGGTLMVFLMGGLLLWLEPLIAAGMAGYLGGRLAKNPWNGILAALSPFIVIGVIGVVVTTMAAPIFAGWDWPSAGMSSGFVAALGQGVAEARDPASPLFAALLTMGFIGGLSEWLYKGRSKI